jgi:hypothetical protein
VDDVRTTVTAFREQTGVRLHVFGLPGDGAPHFGRGVIEGPVDLTLVPRAVPVLQRVVEAYPREVRLQLVPDLWIVGKLRALGHPFLGMAHPKQGRLDVALHRRTAPAALAGTMHHEIAHMLMRHPSFDLDAWRAFSDGHYVGRQPNRKWPTEGRPWLQYGFVEPYSSKNPNEDFATLAEMGFARPNQLRSLAERYDLLGRKLEFLTRAYELLVPGTELPWLDPTDDTDRLD